MAHGIEGVNIWDVLEADPLKFQLLLAQMRIVHEETERLKASKGG